MDTVGAVTSVILGCNDYIINILLDLCKVQSMSRRPLVVLSLFDMYRVLSSMQSPDILMPSRYTQ